MEICFVQQFTEFPYNILTKPNPDTEKKTPETKRILQQRKHVWIDHANALRVTLIVRYTVWLFWALTTHKIPIFMCWSQCNMPTLWVILFESRENSRMKENTDACYLECKEIIWHSLFISVEFWNVGTSVQCTLWTHQQYKMKETHQIHTFLTVAKLVNVVHF